MIFIVHLRLDRYLFREILPPFFVALLAFLVFIGLQLVLSLSDTLYARGASTLTLLRLLAWKLPNLLTLAIPAGALLATFLALSRLVSDRELLALQALGYSLRRILVPFLLFGVLASAVSFALGELVVPRAEAQYRRDLLEILYRGPVPVVQENVFFRGSQGELYYIARYTGEKAEGVVVYDLSGRIYPPASFPTMVTAEEGEITTGRLALSEGRILRFDSQGRLEEVTKFSQLTLEVGEELKEAVLGGRTPSEMSTRELRERIEVVRNAGLDVRNLLIEYHGKLAIAAAALVFVLFGAPVGVLLGRRGRATGMVVGFLLAAAAQGLFLWARTMARQGFLPPYLGGWLPHLLFGSLGICLFLGADRLRLRGSLLILLLGLSLPGIVGSAAPPFQELWAEELTIEEDGRVFQARSAHLVLGEYEISAARLRLEEGDLWKVEAEEASIEGKDSSVTADSFQADLTQEGELRTVALSGFSGEVRFQGPEKEETLTFRGEEGEVEFEEGGMGRVWGRKVQFTTCPCCQAYPYLVEAEEFLMYPEEWLLAQGVTVEAFGHPLAWLPFYASRLGEEGMPLFPEVGRSTLGWFLKWSIPWSPAEGVVGALLLTWYPEAGRLEPGMRAIWDGGSLSLLPGKAALRAEGELWGQPWRGTFSLQDSKLLLDLSGRLEGWSITVLGGLVDEEDREYERLPELSLSRSEGGWLGGTLGLTLGAGRFREGDVVGWRTGTGLTWSRRLGFGPLSLDLPLSLGMDLYPSTSRAYLNLSPSIALGNLALQYVGQWSGGRSPFQFDATPPRSEAWLSLRGEQGGWNQNLRVGWDLAQGQALPGSWTVKHSGLTLSLRFSPLPLGVLSASWEGRLKSGNWVVSASGGLSGPTQWQDLLIRCQGGYEAWSLGVGLRVGVSPLALLRAALTLEGILAEEWSWSIAGEFDFRSRTLVQLEAGVFRNLAGCLRVGVQVGLQSFRLSLDVPAFPAAKVRFAPLDEGLRFGQ